VNIALHRLIEGIIATLRSDVIPNVTDPYARGQTVGVIDLLNNIGQRVEWSRAPLAGSVQAKQQLLREVADLVPGAVEAHSEPIPLSNNTDLLATRNELDAEISDALLCLWPRKQESACRKAIDLIQAHLHDEAANDMKLTRKPLFAEIASGVDQAKT
jgi:hypothetical protein